MRANTYAVAFIAALLTSLSACSNTATHEGTDPDLAADRINVYRPGPGDTPTYTTHDPIPTADRMGPGPDYSTGGFGGIRR